MRTLLAIVAVLALTSAAAAYCPAVPDSVETGYSANAVARSLCLQAELQATTRLRNQAVAVDSAIGQWQRDTVEQKFDSLTQVQPWQPPAFGPSF